TYVTLPGDVDQPQYWRIYNRIVTGAAGIFHLDRVEGQVRELSIRKLRQTAVSTEPFRFTIVPGTGIVEQEPPAARHQVPDDARPRPARRRRRVPDRGAAPRRVPGAGGGLAPPRPRPARGGRRGGEHHPAAHGRRRRAAAHRRGGAAPRGGQPGARRERPSL